MDNPFLYLRAILSRKLFLATFQDLSSGRWFQFSDDVVESLDGKESKLGSEVDEVEAKPAKRAKVL
jgi:hypothetical protein